MEIDIDKPKAEVAVPQWQARLYKDSDRQGILELSALHYGDKELGTEGFFDWLTGGSPAGKSVTIVAEEIPTGKIIGFAFHMPVYAKAGKIHGIGRMGCNAVVHPAYRRLGIYASMAKLITESSKDVLFSYGFPKPMALIPHTRAGRVPVCTIPLLIRPLRTQELTRIRIKNPLLRLAVNLGWPVLRSTIYRPHEVDPDRTAIRLTRLQGFNEKFDRFWERVADKYEIVVERTSSFLNWRFCGQNFRSYQVIGAWDGMDLVGYTVTRYLDLEGVKSGLIMDLMVEPGKRGEETGLLLVQEAVRQFQQDGMLMAGCLMLPHTHEYQILKKAGFIDAPQRFAPQKFMLLTISWSPATPLEYLLQSNRWFVTMANHDAV